MGKEAYGGRRHKSILISATIGRNTIGNKTALQLSTPVWQHNAEGLNQDEE
jgi:hypothetical protein